MKDELSKVRDWAKARVDAGQEPPWSWYQYMKLIEAADEILAGMAATRGCSQPQDEPQGKHLRLVDAADQQDTAQPRSVVLSVQMPT